MNQKPFFLLTLLSVLFICSTAYAQGEEITLSTYYPAPYGEYEELAAENLFCDKQIIGNMDVNGDGQFSTPADIALVNGGNLLVEGRVGIGTTAPRAKLDVIGQIVAGDSSQYAVLDFDGTRARVAASGAPRPDLTFVTNDADRMVITTTGNVGIGTTNPNNKLEIGSSSPSLRLDAKTAGVIPLILQADNDIPLVTDGPYIRTGGGGSLQINSMNKSGASDQYGHMFLNPDVNSNIILVTSVAGTPTAGNVGIGTTNPGEKLEVNGNIKATGLQIPGTVANVVMVQTRTQGTYAAPISGYGTVITPLNLVITPKKAGNRIILEWIVNGEMNQDTVYIVTRNGVLLENTTNATNNRWAGITAQPRDTDVGSSPDNAVVKIIDMNSLDVATTYELRVRSSSGAAYTLYLNRTGNTAGQDTDEASLSTGIATEIRW